MPLKRLTQTSCNLHVDLFDRLAADNALLLQLADMGVTRLAMKALMQGARYVDFRRWRLRATIQPIKRSFARLCVIIA
jgi:hypothetical protein